MAAPPPLLRSVEIVQCEPDVPLHAQIASLFCGEMVADCLEALCRSFATCLVVGADDMDQVENAIVEMAGRVGRYVEACHAAVRRSERVQ